MRLLEKHDVFMQIAEDLSQLGTCDRKQVGAVIVRDGRCITWGFNGAPPGLPHCDHRGDDQPCVNATHAEANALAFAAKQGISTDEATLYVTVSPCEVCSRLIIAAGIREVVYKEKYRDESGLRTLSAACIPVRPIRLQGDSSYRSDG